MLGRQFPGTEKNPQGRLFKPEYTGDPHKLSPENWMKGDASTPLIRHEEKMAFGGTSGSQDPVPRAAGDILTYHTNMGALPVADNVFRGKGPQSRDSKGRAVGEDGSLVGMHFGTVKAGYDRVSHNKDPSAAQAHPVKFHSSAQFGAYDTIEGKQTTPLAEQTRSPSPWSDDAANISEKATDAVETGYAVPYRNDVEDEGSISYRTKRANVRRWSTDVKLGIGQRVGEPHPAYKYLADKGYNPVIETGKIHEAIQYQPRQLPLDNSGLTNPAAPSPDRDEFSKINVHRYNQEAADLTKQSQGLSPQFSQWTMKKNV